jgi:hypothetical protein
MFSVLYQGTASAVPQMAQIQMGFQPLRRALHTTANRSTVQ